LQSELPKITILLALQTDFAHEIFKISVASLVTFWKFSGTRTCVNYMKKNLKEM
jgi:hypothetical protein